MLLSKVLPFQDYWDKVVLEYDSAYSLSDPATNRQHKVTKDLIENNLSPSLDYLIIKNI